MATCGQLIVESLYPVGLKRTPLFVMTKKNRNHYLAQKKKSSTAAAL
jgi:hypothetical protein